MIADLKPYSEYKESGLALARAGAGALGCATSIWCLRAKPRAQRRHEGEDRSLSQLWAHRHQASGETARARSRVI